MGALSPKDLIQSISEYLKVNAMQDLVIICQDGQRTCASLLVIALSPVLQSANCSDLTEIILPDISVAQIDTFLSFLLSPCGPQSDQDRSLFQDTLDLLGWTSFPVFIGDAKPDIESDFEDVLEEDLPILKPTTNRKRKWKKTAAALALKNGDARGEMRELIGKCYESKQNSFACYVCGTERKGSRSMQQHLSWHLKHPTEDYLTCHICKDCGKICADYNAMKFHVRQVHCERSLKCTHQGCDRAFKTQVALKSHLDIHAGVKNYVCSDCGFAFRSKQEMKGHILRKHSDVKKSIPCELCGKLFRHMSNLKSHFNVHKAQSERQHRCDQCAVTFKSEATLKNHMMLHDPSRPFKCSKCPLRYKNKDAWVSHESSHDNPQFACQHCDVSYTRKDNLKRHMKDKHANLTTK